MQLFPEARDAHQINHILSSPHFKNALDKMERRCQKYRSTPIQSLPFSLYRKFFLDGDRRSYEDIYFERRGRLSYLALSILLHHRPEDILALEDAIWAICEENTWVLPAHTSDLGTHYDTAVIDLFSAETGFALSEIIYLIGDELDEKIIHRIKECLEERIFQMYLTHTYTWENVSMNWAAVCAGCVGGAFLYCAPERFHLVHDRIITTMNKFLEGFGDDGICLEGIHYWGYGFGFFTYFAQLLFEFTDGKENLFDNPICQKTAFFQEFAFLRQNQTISFSDGFQTSDFLPGLTNKLHALYGSKLQPMKYAAFSDYCHRFPAYLRNFFWVSSATDTPNTTEVSYKYFPTAQWYISTGKVLSFVAKGGHNDEPHNHNDIGSFALVCDAGQILCDYGAGEYTRDYFLPETRYNYLCNSSFGHSVPIINGAGQCPGKQYCGNVLHYDAGGITIDITKAYTDDRLTSAIREIKLSESTFSLKDTFSGHDLQITERFVTMISPTLDGNRLCVGDYVLENSLSVIPRISSETILSHESHPETLYMIDYEIGQEGVFLLTVNPKK